MTQNRIRINKVYLPMHDLRVRYKVSYGGRRSGKSVFVSQDLIRTGLEYRRRKIVVMRKYATSIRLTVWPRILAAIDEAIGTRRCTIRQSVREIELPTGSTVTFVGADDPEKMKSLEGVTDFWLEEATEFDRMDFETLDAGLSTPCDPPPSFFFTFNPIPVIAGYQHWLQERFLGIDHELGEIAVRGNVAILRTWYKNNTFCPESTIQQLEAYKESNPELYKMWGLGEFTKLKGAILENWDIVPSVPDEVRFLGYGLDFGFAEDPAAVVAVWQHRDEIWIQEKLYAKGLTNPELSEAMIDAGMRPAIDDVVADGAEPKSIAELRKLGWVMRASEKGRDYKRAAANYLRSHSIHILEDSPNAKLECATWSWRQDHDGNVLPIVADGNDHLIDALIYRTFGKETALSWGAITDSQVDDLPLFGQSSALIDKSIPSLEELKSGV